MASVRRCSTGLVVCLTVVALAGCGGNDAVSTLDANTTAANLAGQGLQERGYQDDITSADCARAEGDTFTCVITSQEWGKVSGTLTCDQDVGRCVWRSEGAGG